MRAAFDYGLEASPGPGEGVIQAGKSGSIGKVSLSHTGEGAGKAVPARIPVTRPAAIKTPGKIENHQQPLQTSISQSPGVLAKIRGSIAHMFYCCQGAFVAF